MANRKRGGKVVMACLVIVTPIILSLSTWITTDPERNWDFGSFLLGLLTFLLVPTGIAFGGYLLIKHGRKIKLGGLVPNPPKGGWSPFKIFLCAVVIGEGVHGAVSFGLWRPSWLAWVPLGRTPSFSEVGDFALNHWLGSLIVWGSVMGLLALWAKSKEWKETAQTLQVVAIAILVGAFLIAPLLAWIGVGEESSRAMAIFSGSPKTSGTIKLAGLEKSKLLPVPIGTKPSATGASFRVHCVYRDGSEGTMGSGEPNTCHDGPMFGVYLENLLESPNLVSYEFKKS